MRANSTVREPEIQRLWDENQVFAKVADRNNGVSLVLTLDSMLLGVKLLTILEYLDLLNLK